MANELIKKSPVKAPGSIVEVKRDDQGTTVLEKKVELRTPDTTQVPVGDSGSVSDTRPEGASAIKLRNVGVVETKGIKGRVRQARLRLAIVRALNRLERGAFATALSDIKGYIGDFSAGRKGES